MSVYEGKSKMRKMRIEIWRPKKILAKTENNWATTCFWSNEKSLLRKIDHISDTTERPLN